MSPAYMRQLPRPPSCQTCGRAATHEVFNAVNEPYGPYCETHAKRLVAQLG